MTHQKHAGYATRPLSRRTVLKLLGSGALTLYLRPSLGAWAAPAEPAQGGTLATMSPIDRSLGDVAPLRLFGDESV